MSEPTLNVLIYTTQQYTTTSFTTLHLIQLHYTTLVYSELLTFEEKLSHCEEDKKMYFFQKGGGGSTPKFTFQETYYLEYSVWTVKIGFNRIHVSLIDNRASS